MQSLPIYLDYAASTPVDPRVFSKMQPFLTDVRYAGNPSATHFYGRLAAQAIANAREQVAQLINAEPQAIIWTSGATEANNLALKGTAYANAQRGRHIITTLIEHSAVLDTCAQLSREGFDVTYLPVNADGIVDLTMLRAAIRPDTILVSIMQVNNETGVIQDIAAIGAALAGTSILLHVDAAQSAGKMPIDLKRLPVDLMSFSAHKIYGPKGVGALYINQRRKIAIKPLLNGGEQENALRPGTLATHQIVGMGVAFAIAHAEMQQDIAHAQALNARLLSGLQQLNDIFINGSVTAKLPTILNVAFNGINAKQLLPALKELAVSTGSACHEGHGKRSHVLQALGLSPHLIDSSIRFSFGRFTTANDIDSAIMKINKAVKLLRQI